MVGRADLHSLEDRRVVVGQQRLLVCNSRLAHVDFLLDGGDTGFNLVYLRDCEAHQLVALPQSGWGWGPGQVCGYD